MKREKCDGPQNKIGNFPINILDLNMRTYNPGVDLRLQEETSAHWLEVDLATYK